MLGVPSTEVLREPLQELTRVGQNYRRLYFGRKLGADEIPNARLVVDDMRRLTGVLKGHWDDFRQAEHQVADFWDTVDPRQLKPEEVHSLMGNLITLSSVGSAALLHLDQAVVCARHYERQTTYLEGSDNAEMIREDAIELQAWVEQVARQVRDDVASSQSQIHVVSLYSQTVLTSQINVLTRTLVVLTRVAIVVSLVAALAAALAAGWAIAT